MNRTNLAIARAPRVRPTPEPDYERPAQTSTAVTRLAHMPQLDGLRAIAVGGVIAHHVGETYFNRPWGLTANAGVKLFFVLSGFLITGILLRARGDANSAAPGWPKRLGQFYARRFLRIFPLYYMVIGAAVLFGVDAAREHLIWLLTYTLNLHMAWQGWFVKHFSHFWSLSVEEQFYVFWPWIVFLAPTAYLSRITIAALLIGPLYRFGHLIAWTFFNSQSSGLVTYISTPTCLDSLGIGALLALSLRHRRLDDPATERRLRWWLLTGAVLFAIGNVPTTSRLLSAAFNVVYDTGLALIFAWAVARAAGGFQNVFGRVLEARPVTYIGKISYGLYVYHPLVPAILMWATLRYALPVPHSGIAGAASAAVATLAVSALSWHLFEGPLNSLKRYFEVKQPKPSRAGT